MADADTDGAPLAPVSPDRIARGRGIAERRAALGISSQAEFSRRTGKSRTTIAKAELGTAADNTYLELEAWLNAESGRARAGGWEEDADMPERMEIDITGPTTEWRVTVSGPIEEADILRHQAAELYADLKRLGLGVAAAEMQKEAPRAD